MLFWILQVWFQNARAKYRRNLLKQEQDKQGNNGSSQDATKNTLTELSNSRSPALSDISSSPSLSELQNNSNVDNDQSSSGSGLTELFSTTMNAMNWATIHRSHWAIYLYRYL